MTKNSKVIMLSVPKIRITLIKSTEVKIGYYCNNKHNSAINNKEQYLFIFIYLFITNSYTRYT